MIAEMDDRHLENTIKMILREAINAKNLASIEVQSDPYLNALYGRVPQKPEDVANVVRQALTRTYPYIAEWFLRDLEPETPEYPERGDLTPEEYEQAIEDYNSQEDSIREMLQIITGRKGAIDNGMQSLRLLPGYDPDEDLPL